MSAARVLVVGARDSSLIGLPELPLTADLLQARDRVTDRQRALAGRLELVDLEDVDASLNRAQAMHVAGPLAGVTAFHEQYLDLAARIAERLGIGGNPRRAVADTVDKARARRLAEGCGLANPPWVAVPTLADAPEAMRLVGYPCVVKPAGGSGSMGVRRFDRPDEEALADLGERWDGGGPWLVEAFVDGPELSVETFSRDGGHEVLAITRKTVMGPHCVETGHELPMRLDPALDTRIRDGVVCLLDRVGHRVGPGHTELRLAGGIPYLVETHTRYGGDRIWEMTGLVTGRYPQPQTLAALAGVPAPARPPAGSAAAIRYLTPAPGVVTAVTGVAEAEALPGVVRVEVAVAPGDRVEPLRSSLDRVGFVLAVGDDPEAAARAAEAGCRRIAVETGD